MLRVVGFGVLGFERVLVGKGGKERGHGGVTPEQRAHGGV